MCFIWANGKEWDTIDKQTIKYLRQSLTQGVFHYYDELSRSLSKDRAVEVVLREIRLLEDAFTGQSGDRSFTKKLEEKERFWEKQNLLAKQADDFDKRLYSEDVLAALKTLKGSLKMEESYGAE